MLDQSLLCDTGKHILKNDTCLCDTIEQLEYDLLDHDCHTSPEDSCDCDEIREIILRTKQEINRDSFII